MLTFTSQTPLRISLAGGSTDLQDFLNIYNRGLSLNFAIDLFTYIYMTLRIDNNYKISYSKIEEVNSIKEIRNDIARIVLQYFNMPPITIVFNTDIKSTGSGLASSTSYLISLYKACAKYKKARVNDKKIIQLERLFNPQTGYQDVYGCLYPGLNLFEFNKLGLVSRISLPTTFFDENFMFILYTNETRNSSIILENISIEKRKVLIKDTENLYDAIIHNNEKGIIYWLKKSWDDKKNTSSIILNKKLEEIDSEIENDNNIIAHKLCGAGGGGYFWFISKTPRLDIIEKYECYSIRIQK